MATQNITAIDLVTSAIIANVTMTSQPNTVTSDEIREWEALAALSAEQLRVNVVVIVVLVGVIGVGLMGNLLVVAVYRPRPGGVATSPAVLFILVMAGLDIATCLLSVPYEIADLFLPYHNHNIPVCQTFRLINTLISHSRGFMLLCVAWDRFFKVCMPLKTCSCQHAKVAVVVVLVLGAAISWPQVVVNGHATIATPLPHVLASGCNIVRPLAAMMYHSIMYIVCVVSFITYFILYGRIFYVLWRKGWFQTSPRVGPHRLYRMESFRGQGGGEGQRSHRREVKLSSAGSHRAGSHRAESHRAGQNSEDRCGGDVGQGAVDTVCVGIPFCTKSVCPSHGSSQLQRDLQLNDNATSGFHEDEMSTCDYSMGDCFSGPQCPFSGELSKSPVCQGSAEVDLCPRYITSDQEYQHDCALLQNQVSRNPFTTNCTDSHFHRMRYTKEQHPRERYRCQQTQDNWRTASKVKPHQRSESLTKPAKHPTPRSKAWYDMTDDDGDNDDDTQSCLPRHCTNGCDVCDGWRSPVTGQESEGTLTTASCCEIGPGLLSSELEVPEVGPLDSISCCYHGCKGHRSPLLTAESGRSRISRDRHAGHVTVVQNRVSDHCAPDSNYVVFMAKTHKEPSLDQLRAATLCSPCGSHHDVSCSRLLDSRARVQSAGLGVPADTPTAHSGPSLGGYESGIGCSEDAEATQSLLWEIQASSSDISNTNTSVGTRRSKHIEQRSLSCHADTFDSDAVTRGNSIITVHVCGEDVEDTQGLKDPGVTRSELYGSEDTARQHTSHQESAKVRIQPPRSPKAADPFNCYTDVHSEILVNVPSLDMHNNLQDIAQSNEYQDRGARRNSMLEQCPPHDGIYTVTESALMPCQSSPCHNLSQDTFTPQRADSAYKTPKTSSCTKTEAEQQGRHDTTEELIGGNIRRFGGNRLKIGKTTLMLAMVTLGAMLSFVPFLTVIVLRISGTRFTNQTASTGDLTYMFCIRSYLLNNIINPFVYFYVNPRFRQKVYHMLRFLGQCVARVTRENTSSQTVPLA